MLKKHFDTQTQEPTNQGVSWLLTQDESLDMDSIEAAREKNKGRSLATRDSLDARTAEKLEIAIDPIASPSESKEVRNPVIHIEMVRATTTRIHLLIVDSSYLQSEPVDPFVFRLSGEESLFPHKVRTDS